MERIWDIVKSNSRFNSSDILVVTVNSVKMPEVFGVIKAMGTPLSVMANLKNYHRFQGQRKLHGTRINNSDC